MGILDLQQTYFIFIMSFYLCVFPLCLINRTLKEFKSGIKNRSMSSEGNRTPTAEVVVPSTPNFHSGFYPLNDSDLHELYHTIHPLENDDTGKTLFQRTQQFIYLFFF